MGIHIHTHIVQVYMYKLSVYWLCTYLSRDKTYRISISIHHCYCDKRQTITRDWFSFLSIRRGSALSVPRFAFILFYHLFLSHSKNIPFFGISYPILQNQWNGIWNQWNGICHWYSIVDINVDRVLKNGNYKFTEPEKLKICFFCQNMDSSE